MNPVKTVTSGEFAIAVRNGRFYVGLGVVAAVASGVMAWAHVQAQTRDHARRIEQLERTLERTATKDDVQRLEAGQQQIIKALIDGRR